MGKQYKAEFRAEAVKLSEELGPKAAATRMGVNLDTMYTWISKSAKRTKVVEEIEILQGALGFFVKRQKK